MAFKTGDAVFHPVRGAGVVTDIKDRKRDGEKRRYYTIELLGHPGTRVMIPASTAKEVGLRHAMSQAKLKKVWLVLREIGGKSVDKSAGQEAQKDKDDEHATPLARSRRLRSGRRW